jgi:8-oxo-dGTP diphosphatase
LSENSTQHVLQAVRGFIRRKRDGKFLMLKRSLTDSFQPGLWECPGGRVHDNETFIESLVRECYEETGLTVERISTIPYILSHMSENSRYAGWIYTARFYMAEMRDELVTLSEEHDDFALVDYDEMLQLNLTKETRYVANKFFVGRNVSQNSSHELRRR